MRFGLVSTKAACSALALFHFAGATQAMDRAESSSYTVQVPWLKTDNQTINNAYRIAMGDLIGNISLFRSGLLEKPGQAGYRRRSR